MILPTAVALLFLAILLLYFSRRRSFLLVVLTILGVGLAGAEPLPRALLATLDSPFAELAPPEWGESNAIILLGSGTVRIGGKSFPDVIGYGRVTEAATAYRACVAGGHSCTIVASGGAPRGQAEAEADVMAETLIGLGVPESDIVRETRSRNTFENARFTRQALIDKSFERIFLITSGFHMRRSLLYFRHFGISAKPLPAFTLEPEKTWIPVAFNVALTDIALHEYVGMVRYRFYNAMGWNPDPIEPDMGV